MKTEKARKETNRLTKNERECVNVAINACRDNINSLVKESSLLLKHKYYTRAFMLSYMALEEIGKYMMLADYYEGLVSISEMKSAFYDHKIKIAYLYNHCSLTTNEMGAIDATIIYDKQKYANLFELRNKSMYVDIQNSVVLSPIVEIDEHNAMDILNHVKSRIKKINYYEKVNERRGSKAFYK